MIGFFDLVFGLMRFSEFFFLVMMMWLLGRKVRVYGLLKLMMVFDLKDFVWCVIIVDGVLRIGIVNVRV